MDEEMSEEEIEAHAAALAALRSGDRVRVREGAAHDEMTKGAEGEIAEVSPEPALAIRFDGMDGLHRWYVASELERIEDTTARGRGTETMKKIALRANDKRPEDLHDRQARGSRSNGR